MLKFVGGPGHERDFARRRETAPDTAHFPVTRAALARFAPGLLYYKRMKAKFYT